MDNHFINFLVNCNRDQLIHCAICELDIFELITLVGEEPSDDEPVNMPQKALDEIVANWSRFQEQVSNNILIKMCDVSNEQIILALAQLDVKRQNAIMEDDYDWQLED